jgi:hypothetical protein
VSLQTDLATDVANQQALIPLAEAVTAAATALSAAQAAQAAGQAAQAASAAQVGADVSPPTGTLGFVPDPSGDGSVDVIGPPAPGSSLAYSTTDIQPASNVPSATPPPPAPPSS